MKRKIKKIGCLILILLCFFGTTAFTGCKTSELSSLYSLTKPYIGVYECESATLEGKDILSLFKIVTLELKEGGTFLVIAKPKFGFTVRQEGNYSFDEKAKTITMTATRGKKKYEKTFPADGGVFAVSTSLGGRELVLKFSVKT